MKTLPPPASMSVLDFITTLREARPDNLHYYMNGGCWEMFRILRRIWPEARPFHTWIEFCGHVATKIGDHLYDIRGRVRRPSKYEPMTTDSWPGLRGNHRWHKSYLGIPPKEIQAVLRNHFHPQKRDRHQQ